MKIRSFIDVISGVFGYKVIRQSVYSRLNGVVDENSHSLQAFGQVGFLVPAQNSAPSRSASPQSPACSTDDTFFHSAVESFVSHGVCTISAAASFVENWREKIVWDDNVGNKHPSWDWAGNPIVPYSTPLKTATPDKKILLELKQIFSTSQFDEFFKKTMGCLMTVVNCRLVQSLPHLGEGTGPQSWHVDGCPEGVIRGVLYLVDVDESSGPFQYKDSKGEIHSVLGKAGDCLIFDAQRLQHRALPPKGNQRLAIDLIFQPRLPDVPLEVCHAGMNHWPADPFFFEIPPRRFNDHTSLGLSSVERLY